MLNVILSGHEQYNAIVDGKPTGLSGCKFPCGRECLRTHPDLPKFLIPDEGECRFFISMRAKE